MTDKEKIADLEARLAAVELNLMAIRSISCGTAE